MAFAAPEGTELVRLLGGGSVFQVGLVRSRDRELVCKRLTPQALEVRAGRAAMVREARLLSIINHHALPRLVRVGNDKHGPFFLETFVHGTSLRDIIRGWNDKGSAVPRSLIRHITVVALQTLSDLHEHADEIGPLEIVHGDLSPDHVLLGPLGDVRFVDLGAARFRGLDTELDTDDRGTVPYAAPEVVRGDDKPGQHSDVYALCATLLWFATGERLCEASTDAAMLAEVASQGIRRDLVERAAAFEPHERAQIHAALDPDVANRPRSAKQILEAFSSSGARRDIAREAR